MKRQPWITDPVPTLYDLCKAYVEAFEFEEKHPDYPHGPAAIEYAEDQLIDHFADRRAAADS